jgi:hypothetical protein
MAEYVVITQNMITTDDDGFQTIYTWDGTLWDYPHDAIDHGFELRRSDDFNIGKVVDGQLSGFSWMYEELPGYDLHEIAAQIGLLNTETTS